MRAAFFRVAGDPGEELETGAITLWGLEYPGVRRLDRTIAVGRYGNRTAFVRAGFDDDTWVTATLRDGWYAMWWPGGQRPAVIVAANARNEALGSITPP